MVRISGVRYSDGYCTDKVHLVCSIVYFFNLIQGVKLTKFYKTHNFYIELMKKVSMVQPLYLLCQIIKL